VVGGLIAFGIYVANLPPKPTNEARKETDPVPTPITSSSITVPSVTKPDEGIKDTKPIPTNPIPTKMATVPLKVTTAELLKTAKVSITNDPLKAVNELIELAGRYQTGEPYQPESLLLAAECYRKLLETEPKRVELKGNYASYAQQYFKGRSSLLKDDSEKIDWIVGSQVALLSNEQEPWTLAYRIEKLLHQDKLDVAEEAMLQRFANVLPNQLKDLGGYGRYLQGAIAAKLKNASSAAEAFLKLEKDDITWSPARTKLITTTLEPRLNEHRSKAFQLDQWQQPIKSATDANAWLDLISKFEAWKLNTSGSSETRWLKLLVEATTTKDIASAKDFIKRWPSEEPPAALRMPLAQQLFVLMRIAKEPAEAILPVVSQLFRSLPTMTGSKLSAEETVKLYDGWIQEVSMLTRLANLKGSTADELAKLFGARAQLILENTHATWVRKENRLATAERDLAEALTLTDKRGTPDRAGYLVWQAFAKRELKRSEWKTLASRNKPSNVPPSAVPVLYFLLGNVQLEEARLAKTREARLKLVEEATTQFKNQITESKEKSELNHWLNLGKLGVSQCYLENANYLEMTDRNREGCRKLLEESIKLATEVVKDPQAAHHRADAELALGNACEDFGLLLDEPRHDQAIGHFSTAITLLKDHPLEAKALMNRARAMYRSEDKKHDQQLDEDIRYALTLKPEGDIASELYVLKGLRERLARKYVEARASFDTAINRAASKLFKDDARCKLLELVINLPLSSADMNSSTKMKGRADDIKNLLINVDEVDPQVRDEAEYQVINAWNELDNCYLSLIRLSTQTKDQKVNKDFFWEYLHQLKISKDEMAHWHAAKQEGRLAYYETKIQEAWSSFDMNGGFDQAFEKLVKMPIRERKRKQFAFYSMALNRYDLLLDRSEPLKKHLEESIKQVDRICKFIPESDINAIAFQGFSGLTRFLYWWRHTAQDVDEATREKVRNEARSILEKTLNKTTRNKYAWRWAYALSQLEEKEAKKQAYIAQAIELLGGLTELDISKEQKDVFLSGLERLKKPLK
jgi:hypothetical protein